MNIKFWFKKLLTNEKSLFLIYIVLVTLSSLVLKSKIYIPFYLAFGGLAGFLFFGKERISTNKERIDTNHEWSKWLIIIPIIIIFVARIILFIGFEAPLGHDTGIYKKFIEDSAKSLPNLPDFNSVSWISNQPVGLFLSTNLLSLIGLSSEQILYGYYILLNLLLALSVYALAKKFFGQNTAIFALFIFAFSLTQFWAYWMMYYKNIAALFLILMSFWLLKEKSWLAIPVAGFLGGLHRPTFLIFSLAMLFHLIFNKDKRHYLITGFGILAIAFSLYIHNPQAILYFFSPDLTKTVQTLGIGAEVSGGTFFDFDFYCQLITFYLPFAILGFIYLIQRSQFNYLFFYFIFNFAIVYFKLIFHNRFVIHLDIITIILAGVGGGYILIKTLANLWVKVIVIFLIVGALYIFVIGVQTTKPLISDSELKEIKSLANIEEGAYVITPHSYYAPWVYGYSQRKTIAPGLFEFEYDKWDKGKWETFRYATDIETRYKLLDEYEKPLYIFIGDKQRDLRLILEQDSKFVKYSQRVYKYIK